MGFWPQSQLQKHDQCLRLCKRGFRYSMRTLETLICRVSVIWTARVVCSHIFPKVVFIFKFTWNLLILISRVKLSVGKTIFTRYVATVIVLNLLRKYFGMWLTFVKTVYKSVVDFLTYEGFRCQMKIILMEWNILLQIVMSCFQWLGFFLEKLS